MDDRLLRFGYVFYGSQRVLGIYGRLARTASAELSLVELAICCSGVGRTVGRRELDTRLRACGWTEVTRRLGSCWRLDDLRLLILPNGRARAKVAHLALVRGAGLHMVQEHVSLVRGRRPEAVGSLPPAGERDAPRLVSIDRVAARIRAGGVVVYTGAGISRASGIRTFAGDDSLGSQLPLDEPFPGTVGERMIDSPGELVTLVRSFQETFTRAEPNAAHAALMTLERLGLVVAVVTENLDGLHERAGSRVVEAPLPFLDRLEETPQAFSTLLVVGVSNDREGVVSAARGAGVRVLVVDPARPSFLAPPDGWICGVAEEVLPRLAAVCGTDATPLSGSRTLELVLQHATSEASMLHGVGHWQRVALAADLLARDVPGANPWVAFLFAVVHDALRLSDGSDPDHGSRAAALVRTLGGEALALDVRELELLAAACEGHAEGATTPDPAIGLCWDADRLNLWRVGVVPRPDLLSTDAARRPATIEWARSVQEAAALEAPGASWQALEAAAAADRRLR